MATKRTIRYSEPADYFPESVRKKNKSGEYAEKETPKKETAKKTDTKKADTKKK